MHQVGPRVHERLDQAVVVRAAALDHVGGQGPGAAGEADQGHAAVERAADGGDRVEDVAQLVHVGHGEGADVGLGAHGLLEPGALTEREVQAQAHGVGDGEDVGEEDGRVERVALQRLQGDFGGVVDVGGQAHEAAGLGARGAVLGQVAAGLPHQPHGGVVGGLAQAGAQETVVLQGSKRHEVTEGQGVSGDYPLGGGALWVTVGLARRCLPAWSRGPLMRVPVLRPTLAQRRPSARTGLASPPRLARPLCGKREWGLRPDTHTIDPSSGLAGHRRPDFPSLGD